MQVGQKSNPWVNVGEYLQANKPYQEQYATNMADTYDTAMKGLNTWQSDIATPTTPTAMTTDSINDVSGIQMHADAGVTGGWDAYQDRVKSSLAETPAAPNFTPTGDSNQKAENTFSSISETPTVENIISGFQNLSGISNQNTSSQGGQGLDKLIMSGTDVEGIVNPYMQQFNTYQDTLASQKAAYKTAADAAPGARNQSFNNIQEVMSDLEKDNVTADEINQYNALRGAIGLEPIEAYVPPPPPSQHAVGSPSHTVHKNFVDTGNTIKTFHLDKYGLKVGDDGGIYDGTKRLTDDDLMHTFPVGMAGWLGSDAKKLKDAAAAYAKASKAKSDFNEEPNPLQPLGPVNITNPYGSPPPGAPSTPDPNAAMVIYGSPHKNYSTPRVAQSPVVTDDSSRWSIY